MYRADKAEKSLARVSTDTHEKDLVGAAQKARVFLQHRFITDRYSDKGGQFETRHHFISQKSKMSPKSYSSALLSEKIPQLQIIGGPCRFTRKSAENKFRRMKGMWLWHVVPKLYVLICRFQIPDVQ